MSKCLYKLIDGNNWLSTHAHTWCCPALQLQVIPSLTLLKYIASGTIRLQAVDMPERLNTIFDDLTTIIQKYEPNCVVIEQVFFYKNAQSALKLGYARGIAACC